MSTQTPEINFYKVLGVSQDARESDIKAAYRKLAKLYHPGKLTPRRPQQKKHRIVSQN
jgi:DnaJ-class molecular chaperone